MNEYIADFPAEIQEILQKIRQTIRDVAPEADEKISYGMPTFTLHGNLIHFAAFKNHIGLYPTPSGVEKFKDKLAVYKNAKGSVQFPLESPIPYDLIRDIAVFRVEETLEKARAKVKKKK